MSANFALKISAEASASLAYLRIFEPGDAPVALRGLGFSPTVLDFLACVVDKVGPSRLQDFKLQLSDTGDYFELVPSKVLDPLWPYLFKARERSIRGDFTLSLLRMRVGPLPSEAFVCDDGGCEDFGAEYLFAQPEEHGFCYLTAFSQEFRHVVSRFCGPSPPSTRFYIWWHVAAGLGHLAAEPCSIQFSGSGDEAHVSNVGVENGDAVPLHLIDSAVPVGASSAFPQESRCTERGNESEVCYDCDAVRQVGFPGGPAVGCQCCRLLAAPRAASGRVSAPNPGACTVAFIRVKALTGPPTFQVDRDRSVTASPCRAAGGSAVLRARSAYWMVVVPPMIAARVSGTVYFSSKQFVVLLGIGPVDVAFPEAACAVPVWSFDYLRFQEVTCWYAGKTFTAVGERLTHYCLYGTETKRFGRVLDSGWEMRVKENYTYGVLPATGNYRVGKHGSVVLLLSGSLSVAGCSIEGPARVYVCPGSEWVPIVGPTVGVSASLDCLAVYFAFEWYPPDAAFFETLYDTVVEIGKQFGDTQLGFLGSPLRASVSAPREWAGWGPDWDARAVDSYPHFFPIDNGPDMRARPG